MGTDLPARELAEADYDLNGRPIGTVSITYRTYDSVYGPQLAWVAEYNDLPGYIGEGATAEDAIARLWQDFGARPHYRVKRIKRTPEKWAKYIRDKHVLASEAARTGAWTKKVISIEDAAQRIKRQKNPVRKAVNDFHDAFGAQANGDWVAGDRQLAAREIARIQEQKIEIDLVAATCTPWRAERQEARAKFPSDGRFPFIKRDARRRLDRLQALRLRTYHCVRIAEGPQDPRKETRRQDAYRVRER